jgi:type I restriction enzyme S subunit
MEAVDEWSARIASYSTRPFREVSKGYTKFAENDVLLAKITPCMENGKCALARGLREGVGFGTTEFHVLRASEQVLPEWLYHFWRFPKTRECAERAMTGSAGQKRVPSSYLETLKVPLPNLCEQKRITKLFEQADRLRRTRRYALELTDTFLPAAFLRLFGDLRLNTCNWAFAELDDQADIVSGIAKGQKYGDRKTVMAPYLRVANVQDGFLDLSEIKMIQALPQDVESLRLMAGDVVMTEGGDYDKLGRGAIWPGDIPNCIHQNHIFRVRVNQEKLLPTFFAAFLRSPFAKDYFLSCSKQTTNLASINMTQLRATPIPLPSLDKQRHFAAIVERHERLRVKQRESLHQAEHLFQTLLHQAFAV